MDYQHVKYSATEVAMLMAIGIESELLDFVSPTQVYNAAVHKCFVGRISGPVAESLKLCIVALEGGSARRLTPEFDALIQLELNHNHCDGHGLFGGSCPCECHKRVPAHLDNPAPSFAPADWMER